MLEYLSYKKFKSKKDKETKPEASEVEAGSSTETASKVPLPDAQLIDAPQVVLPGTTMTENDKVDSGISDGTATPILSDEDEQFISELVTTAKTPPVVILNNGSESVEVKDSAPEKDESVTADSQYIAKADKGKSKESIDGTKKTKEQASALAYGKEVSEYLRRVFSKDKVAAGKGKGKSKTQDAIVIEKPEEGDSKDKGKQKATGDQAADTDESEFAEVLEQLHLASKDGKLFSLSADYKSALRKFTQILKDINNGVPTAYNDLIELFDTSSGTFSKVFESLPKTLQKLITQTLPSKLTPELLRTLAAASPALAAEAEAGAALGLKELVTKPGMIAGLLKSVIQILKTRFPLVMGGGMAAGMGVTVVMMILWYCYKRGKEVRLEEEAVKAESTETGALSSIEPESVGEGSSKPTINVDGKEQIKEHAKPPTSR